MKYLGEKLYELRCSKNMDQKEIANKFYVKSNTWCQYEKNRRRPDIDLLKQIANYFNISIDYLLGTTELKFDPKDNNLITIISIYQNIPKSERHQFLNHIKNFKIKD